MWRIENLGELGIFALVFRKNEGKWAKNILFPLVLLYCCRATRDEQVWQRDTSTKNISLPILFVWVLFLFYRCCFVCMCFIWNFFVFPLLLCFLGTREKQVGQPWAPEYIFLPRNLYIELLPPNIFLIFNDLCIGFFFSALIAGAHFADKTGNSCLSLGIQI